MGDYGFKGAGEFGGQDTNFNCGQTQSPSSLEFSVSNCPLAKRGMFGDDWTDTRLACELTNGPDADGRGFGYDECNFKGNDYRECFSFRQYQKKTKIEGENK
jgi:hypothetical protein